jgi:uncharacterized membrane protein YesL
MSGFINNYYYGKAGKADFTPENLPDNRVKLFFDMLRIHFGGLCGVNLMYLLFCIPALYWTALNVGVLTAVESDALSGHLLIFLAGLVPCLALAGVAAPGLMYVVRNWARDQHVFVFSDFKDAVKENWKYGLLIGLFNGLSLLISYVSFVYYGQMAQNAVFWNIPWMLVLMVLAIWWMINMLIFTMMVTYEMNLKTLLRNSALVAVARLPWSLLFLVGSFLIPLLIAIFIPYGYIAIIIFYLVVGFALTGLVYASYANSCFDKYLNPRIEGAPVNMGLRAKDLDDDDEDDDDDQQDLHLND